MITSPCFRTILLRLLNAGIVTFAAQASIACASTNEASLASCLSLFALADKAETTAYYSDSDAEILKFLRGTNRVTAVGENAMGDKKSHTLSAIPAPRSSDNAKDAIKTTKDKGEKSTKKKEYFLFGQEANGLTVCRWR